MSMLAATTLAALLVASPNTSDAARLATNGGFLLGSAQRCGIADQRIVEAGQRIRNLIDAAAADAGEQEQATLQFARFFIVSSVVDGKTATLAPSCDKVAKEFARLERHHAGAGAAIGSAKGGGRRFRLGDGG